MRSCKLILIIAGQQIDSKQLLIPDNNSRLTPQQNHDIRESEINNAKRIFKIENSMEISATKDGYEMYVIFESSNNDKLPTNDNGGNI